jgi:hypothetical protein
LPVINHLGSTMRSRTIAALTAAAVALGAAGLFGTADAGGNAQVYKTTFTVEKVVVGPVPDGAVFEVEVTCESLSLGAPGAGAATDPGPVTMKFDDNGDPLGMNMISPGFGYACTAVETVTHGAAVSYACAVPDPVVTPVAPTVNGHVLARCNGDQTVEFGGITADEGDSAEPELEIHGAEGTVTVTNTFEEPPPVEPPPATAPAAAQAGVVAARPTFTG